MAQAKVAVADRTGRIRTVTDHRGDAEPGSIHRTDTVPDDNVLTGTHNLV